MLSLYDYQFYVYRLKIFKKIYFKSTKLISCSEIKMNYIYFIQKLKINSRLNETEIYRK